MAKTDEMYLKRAVTAKREKLAKAEIRLKKLREDIEQQKCTALEYGGRDVPSLCLCYVLPKFMSATSTQLSSEGEMSRVGQLCVKTSSAAGGELGVSNQYLQCDLTAILLLER